MIGPIDRYLVKLKIANAENAIQNSNRYKNIFFTRPDKLQDKYKSHLDFCLGRIDLGGQNRHHCKK